MELPIKHIILTGASGFIGSRFLQDFKAFHNIIPISLRKTAVTDIDFTDVDTVIHCAALVHQMQGAPAGDYFRINRDLTVALAKAAKQNHVKHFIFLSTAHVFGSAGTLFEQEKMLSPTSPCHPQDAYGQSKLDAENELQKLNSQNFIVSIIRPPMVYGEGAKGNIQSLVKLIKAIPILPLGYSKNKRSLIYVGNLVDFIGRLTNNPTSSILLPQDPKPVTIQELAQMISKSLDKRRWVLPVSDMAVRLLYLLSRKLAIRLYGSLCLDSRDSFEKLSYTPKYDTITGLSKMTNQKKFAYRS